MQTQSIENIEYIDFRDWLSKEFTGRCRRNPKYSIRAFAQLLDMNSSSVSQLLSGKRKASAKMVKKLATKLSASPHETLAMVNHVKSLKMKDFSNHDAKEYGELTLDAYALIADWYHYAILEITFVDGFKSDPKWIANMLDITTAEAKIAIERLKRLELLDEKDGVFYKTEVFITNFSEGVTSSALKQLQRKVLDMALDAIDNVAPAEKDITSMTMSIVPEKLPQAKKLIKKFRRDISEFLEDGIQKRVYHLGIQLYPVSKKIKK